MLMLTLCGNKVVTEHCVRLKSCCTTTQVHEEYSSCLSKHLADFYSKVNSFCTDVTKLTVHINSRDTSQVSPIRETLLFTRKLRE